MKVARSVRTSLAAVLVVALVSRAPAPGQDRLTVVEVIPAARSLAAPVDSDITVRFDRPILGSSVTAASFWAFGRWSGPVTGSFSESFDGLSVSLVPDRGFSAGEIVTVFLSRDLTAGDGTTLRSAGYSFQFWTRSRGTGLDFREIDRLSTRSSPATTTRAYGGFGSDLDGDGFLDLTIVNEDSNDLRTFLNRADRSGRLRSFLRPPARVGSVPSPSEPSDFDRDGHVDVAVANTQDRTVSILLGNGDGTFAPSAAVEVGGEPRGIAVLDADGDGDVDVAATSFTEGTVTVLLNDGTGTFGESKVFGTGGGERALASGDMTGDGILDLVVGDLALGVIRIYEALGDADFRLTATRSSGGEVWMLVLGDVDGDGSEDVAAVNSRTNNAAILLGDGGGGLSSPRMVATDDFPLATDLADLDGDGDLDWVTSSFFGDWLLFENRGGGSFRLAETFAAPEAASCSLPMDLDNDGVLDLVLIDELADEIVIMGARAVLLEADFETADTSQWSRARGPLAVVEPGLGGTGHALEVPLDGGAAGVWVESRRPSREASLEVELLIDPRQADLGGAAVEILRLGGGRGEARLFLETAGARHRVRLLARERAGFREVGAVSLRSAGVTRLTVEWASAGGPGAANGWASLEKKGRVVAVAADLDNGGRTIRRLRLGLPVGAGGAAAGAFRIDEVSVSR